MPSYDPANADRVWYTENIRFTKYADRKWPIFCLHLPLAMTLALLVAVGTGWLPRVPLPRMVCALILVYLAPALVLLLSAVSRYLLLIPSLALAAYLFRFSVEILTLRRPRRFVFTLLVSTVLCSLLYVTAATISRDRSWENLAVGIFITANEVIAAGLYGKSLTSPANLGPHPQVQI